MDKSNWSLIFERPKCREEKRRGKERRRGRGREEKKKGRAKRYGTMTMSMESNIEYGSLDFCTELYGF